MLEGVKSKMKGRLAEARLRETRYLMSFDLSTVNRRLLLLLSVFVALNFFDAATTLLAIWAGPTFVELNPIASNLFKGNFSGFVIALVLKYMPVVPLAYATFLPAKDTGKVSIRIVKVSAFIALAAADVFYIAVVGSNALNLSTFYH